MASEKAIQCFCVAPKNKVKLDRNLVKHHQFKEGDIIKVITPDGARYSIRLKEREGDLWFGKHWKLVNQIYGSKTNQVLLIVKNKGVGRDHMVKFREDAFKADYPLKPDGVTHAGFFMEIADQDSLRRLILPAAVKDIFRKNMNHPTFLSYDGVSKSCKWEIVDERIVIVDGWNEFAHKLSIKVGDLVFFNYYNADFFAVRVWRQGDPEILFTSAQPSDGGSHNRNPNADAGEGGSRQWRPKIAWGRTLANLAADAEEHAICQAGIRRERQIADEDGRQGGQQSACLGADASEGTSRQGGPKRARRGMSKTEKYGDKTLWTSTLSAKAACGLHPYYIPKEAVKWASQIKSERFKIMIPSGEIQEWVVIRDDPKTFRIGRGWYQFREEAALVEGDTLCFYMTDDEDVIKVDIHRNK